MSLRSILLLVGISAIAAMLLQFGIYVWTLRINDFTDWAWILFYAQFAYILASFRIVNEEEVGALIFFGDPLGEVPSGLSFVPAGIFTLWKDKMTFHQMELPADPEHIYHGKDDVVPDGKYPPIRVTSATKASATASDGTVRHLNNDADPLDNDRITYEVAPIVRWKIQRGEYVTFLRTIGSPEEVRRQFSDTATAFVVEQLSQCTVAYVLHNLARISEHLRQTLEATTQDGNVPDTADGRARNNWGIALDSARIKMPSFHRDLNVAIAAPAVAKLNAQATVTTAGATKEKLRLEGEGAAAAEQASIDARTAGFKRQARALGVHASLVISAETARGIAESPNEKIIIPGSGGFSDLIGGAMAIAETVRGRTANQQPDQDQPPTTQPDQQ